MSQFNFTNTELLAELESPKYEGSEGLGMHLMEGDPDNVEKLTIWVGTEDNNLYFWYDSEEKYNQDLRALELWKQKDKLQDRFFLEEVVHRLKNKDYEYVEQLTGDWLSEQRQELPLTEEERSLYLKESGWDEDFLQAAYFPSEQAIDCFHKGEEHTPPADDVEVSEYSIVDETNNGNTDA